MIPESISLITVLSLLLLSTADLHSQMAAAEAPDIQFETTTYDFGEANPNSVVEHLYTFKNAGNAPLAIAKVTSSCGCTATALNKDQIQPGEQGEIKVTLRVPSMRGATTKSIYVESNDPDQPRVVLSIKGKVVTEWVFEPSERVTFGRIASEDVQLRTVKIFPHENQELKITDAKIDAPEFDVSFEKIPDENAWKLDVKTKPDAGLGTKRGMVTLKTTSEKMPEAEISILAFITGRVGVTPEQLVLRPRQPGTTRGYLFVRSYENKPLRVDRVDPPWAGAKVELTPLSNQTIWRVMITLDDLPEKEPLKGSMTIVTGDPDPRYSKFEVPVTVYPPLTTQVTTARTLTTRPSLDVQTSPNRAVSQPVRVPPAASVSQPVKVPAQTTPPGPPPRPDTK
jgi:hypothetical protein